MRKFSSHELQTNRSAPGDTATLKSWPNSGNKAFSDYHVVVEEIIDARGENGNGMVGARSKMHGVHTGEFFGIAPTGRDTEVRTHEPACGRCKPKTPTSRENG